MGDSFNPYVCCLRTVLPDHQQKLTAGGYEPLRPLSTREHVQLLRQELADMRTQLLQRQPPRDLKDEAYEQQRAFDQLLRRAEQAQASNRDSSGAEEEVEEEEESVSDAEGEPTSPRTAQAPAAATAVAALAAVAGSDVQEAPAAAPPPSAAAITGTEVGGMGMLQRFMSLIGTPKTDEEAAASLQRLLSLGAHQRLVLPGTTTLAPAEQQQQQGLVLPSAAAMAQTQQPQQGPQLLLPPPVLAAPLRPRQQESQQPLRQQTQQTQMQQAQAQQLWPSVVHPRFLPSSQGFPPQAAGAMSRAGIRGFNMALAPYSQAEQQPVTQLQRIAAAAAAAAVAAVQQIGSSSAEGATHAATAAAAAAAIAAIPPCTPCTPSLPPQEVNHSSSKAQVRVIPEPRTFQSVQHLMLWANQPRFEGKSVLQLESAGDIKWRSQRPVDRVLWRKLSLVVRRVNARSSSSPSPGTCGTWRRRQLLPDELTKAARPAAQMRLLTDLDGDS